MILAFNVCQAVLLNNPDPYNELMGTQDDIMTESPDEIPTGLLGAPDILGMIGLVFNFIGFFFGGFIFTLPTLPVWMALFTGVVYFILLLGFWGLVIDFIKDITIVGSHI